MLQRIYGTAWENAAALKEHLVRLEEAAKRDHRKLGKALDLFHMQDNAPGMVFWHPKGWSIWQQVEQYLRQLHSTYSVQEFVYDPAYFQRSAEHLADDGLPMVEFPQSSGRMIPACGHAYEQIVNRKVAHDGSPTYTDQVLSAAQRMTDQGWRLSKGKSKRKIDAAIALVMALDRATSRQATAISPNIVQVWS
jgi:phage terminase large subunit-like protein